MPMKSTQWFVPGLLAFSMALAGCNDDSSDNGDSNGNGGGSEYSGSTDAATLDDGNAEDLAQATISAAGRAISNDTVQENSPFSPNTVSTGTAKDPKYWILEQTGLLAGPRRPGTDSALFSEPVESAGRWPRQ